MPKDSATKPVMGSRGLFTTKMNEIRWHKTLLGGFIGYALDNDKVDRKTLRLFAEYAARSPGAYVLSAYRIICLPPNERVQAEIKKQFKIEPVDFPELFGRHLQVTQSVYQLLNSLVATHLSEQQPALESVTHKYIAKSMGKLFNTFTPENLTQLAALPPAFVQLILRQSPAQINGLMEDMSRGDERKVQAALALVDEVEES